MPNEELTQKHTGLHDRRSIRNVLVNRPMQREFTLITIAIMMFSAVLISFIIHLTLQEQVAESVGKLGRIGVANILYDVSYELIVRITLVLFLTIIAVGTFGIFFLHRVAGPAYRFHQLFKRLRRDDIPRNVKLRQNDFFKEIAEELNVIFDVLRKRKDTVESVERLLASVSEQDLSQETRGKIGEAKSLIQSLKIPPSD